MGSAAGKGKVPPAQAINAYGEVEVQIYSFLTRNLIEVSGQPHAPVTYPREESPRTHWVEG